jgi:hypothetical protein
MIFWGVVFALWLPYVAVLFFFNGGADRTTELLAGGAVVLLAGLGVCMVGTVQALRGQTLGGKTLD